MALFPDVMLLVYFLTFPATKDEKEVARAACSALDVAIDVRKGIKYSVRQLSNLERSYTKGKVPEKWAP